MTNRERRDMQLPYISDREVMEEQKRARRLTQELNTVDRSDFETITKIVKELLGKSEDVFINPPFYCDYGTHIEVGKNFMANYNCTILDVAKVKIGGNTVVCPGVHIGNNVVIGAGSVVTKDIPDWVVAAGNPCKVIRKITKEDEKIYFKGREFDQEAWDEVQRIRTL